MKELKEVIMDMHEKLECAEEYAKEAVKHREQYPELAAVYYRISADDLAHMDMLHKQAVEMIDKKKREGREVPAPMQAVWDWEHEKMMDETVDVKRLLDMYKA